MVRRSTLRAVVASTIALLCLGNVAILVASVWARRTATPSAMPIPPGLGAIRSFGIVDDRLWRGGVPDEAACRALAAARVTTIVDLRAERGARAPEALLDELGVTRVAIPVRDGQAPSAAQVTQLLDAVTASAGPTYVHCGAGVGRTGAMVAAYGVATGQAPAALIRANLAVGPPSLEQLAFAACLRGGPLAGPPLRGLVWLSRALDSPRRTWHALHRAD